MTASGAATTAAATASERPASGTATVAIPSTLSVSNKPMVPTAYTWPAGNPIDPVRRPMGRPLGRRRTPRIDRHTSRTKTGHRQPRRQISDLLDRRRR